MKKTFRDLKKYKKNFTSQYGENGILDAILKKLGIDGGSLIEFGANDGKYFSNTYHLLETGKWFCTYIEPHEKYRELEKLTYEFGDRLLTLNIPIHTKNMSEYVPGTSLDEIINMVMEKHCPHSIDIISIDIDSYDYKIFRELEYKPKIIIIEINAFIEEGVEYIDRQKPNIFGSSYTSTIKLGKEKGYVPLIHVGCNIFFVREDLCEGFILPGIKFDTTMQEEYNEITKI